MALRAEGFRSEGSERLHSDVQALAVISSSTESQDQVCSSRAAARRKHSNTGKSWPLGAVTGQPKEGARIPGGEDAAQTAILDLDLEKTSEPAHASMSNHLAHLMVSTFTVTWCVTHKNAMSSLSAHSHFRTWMQAASAALTAALRDDTCLSLFFVPLQALQGMYQATVGGAGHRDTGSTADRAHL